MTMKLTIVVLSACLALVRAQAPSWFSECEGFGCGATDRYTHTICTMTTLTQTALENCLDREYVHVQFAVSGTLQLTSSVKAPRGTIIDGSGRSVTFTGWDLFLSYQSIVYKVTFNTGFDDAISLRGEWNNQMGDIWIHHCTFTNYADGLVDITRGLSRVTVSWSHFYNHDKCMLISQDENDDLTDRITVHHNFFYEVVQRMPRVRYAHVHVYNNVYEECVDYAIASSQFGRVLVENNVFLPSSIKNYRCTRITPMGDDTANGYLRHAGNNFYAGCFVESYMPGNVPDANYPYNLEAANDDLTNKVKSGAGNK